MSERLAILGGAPTIADPLPSYASVGEAEADAVAEVVRSGILSGFLGAPGAGFYGGRKVRAFEDSWRARYGVKHALAVNSNTSGLFAAMGAVGVGPGDEVIVPPYTMSATVVAPLIYGGIPVFVDIEPETFCLDPAKVREAITPKTRAIVAVNLFGHPARLAELRAIADEQGIFLVEDTAQAPLAHEDGRLAGTVGHIGVFSLNYHKHIHTGEGGMCVTDDDGLARRVALIRNHGENLTDDLDESELANIVGFNFRMPELSAAVGIAQLADIDRHVARREELAEALSDGARNIEGLTPPVVRDGCRHNYYCWALRYDEAALNLSRTTFCRALAAEGFPHMEGYIRPLYMLPMFQRRKAIGRDGFPFTLGDRRYEAGLCPVTERLQEHEVILFLPCVHDVDEALRERLVGALAKVHAGIPALRALESEAVASE